MFLLKSLTNNLNSDRETMHLISIVVDIGPFSHPVQPPEPKCIRQLVKISIYTCNGDDAATIIKLLLCQGRAASRASDLTKLKRKVYPQLLTESFIASCGNAGVAFGTVKIKSGFDSSCHHACHRALYASRLATSFHCWNALLG